MKPLVLYTAQKLRRCVFPVNPVDFHFCENDQKKQPPTPRAIPARCHKNQHKHYRSPASVCFTETMI